jgi:hypothetical protein
MTVRIHSLAAAVVVRSITATCGRFATAARSSFSVSVVSARIVSRFRFGASVCSRAK